MADISNIITELETIATAQVGIESFEYSNIFDLNTFRTTTKPMMIVQRQTELSFPDFQKKFKDYQLKIGIYDDYNLAEQQTTAYASKQKELEDLMEQFLREFRSRSLGETTQVTTPQDWFMQSGTSDLVRMELIEIIGNDKLIAIESTVTVRTFSDCDVGTFNY